ncbi:3-oxoacyl-[acyl-carrier-protein] reductase [Lacihabitans sp. LS3-19]|uniref:3-oxoacyl-[acyl-carrier-protein] reductase n=1 Tax=Lacihabitans sp. LS3-19 TaxID=2487335 RepID=UPI0020CBEB58|nr:3-oxoacyl-[acyl-carrier-protein] reductase [Lacihabitans sp. LS3-19]MCP9766279.1 3-oxoacyl-[acyl-carrier-protein] reductase [Lacihabitans sp. LS3-19]
MKLENKVAVITGGARGIGKAAAELFAKEGATVIIWDLLDAGQETAEEIVKAGGKAQFMKVAVTDVAGIENAVSEIIKEHHKIDILINNAGITRDKSMLKMTHDEWQSVLDVNLTGVFKCTKAIVPHMVEQKYGRIICTSSVVGIAGNFGQTNYVATKAAIIGMVKTWAKEFGKHNITANAVAPGFIKTDMTDLMPKEVIDKMVSEIPSKRMGLPIDIANAYLFLASEDASFVNGHTLSVNGGIV